eukprot:s402_g13.t1
MHVIAYVPEPQTRQIPKVVKKSSNPEGILVRVGPQLESQALRERLALGAKVRQLQLLKGRLEYRLEEGKGPSSGWVSVALAGKELLVRAEEAAPEQCGEEEWEVVGGTNPEGIIVRTGRELGSAPLALRLGIGSRLRLLPET